MTAFLDSKELELSLSYMEGLNSPVSLSVAILMRYGDWVQVLNKTVNPRDYLYARDYFRDNSACCFLKKLERRHPDINPDAVALETWHQSEKGCFQANRRLSRIEESSDPSSTKIYHFLMKARSIVAEILGSAPETLRGRLGPGSTLSDPSRHSSVLDKFSSNPTITTGALHLVPLWAKDGWGRAVSHQNLDLVEVSGNTYFTVPKSAKTSRSCAMEASINVYYQLAVGMQIRTRLRRYGLDLVSGAATHARLAHFASCGGGYSTIDLSSASDTICYKLVELLLPKDWFDLLVSLRSPTTTVEGRVYHLEKFSSMGNGFTFELETLIFLALCRACGVKKGQVTVYGDDIIIPQAHYEDVTAALKFCGFTLNSEKSFRDGSFFESCGGDYFDGLPVRAFYLKEFPHEPQNWITLANAIRRVCSLVTLLGCDARAMRRCWFSCLGSLPVAIRRCRGPSTLGDVVIHDIPVRWQQVTKHSIRYFRAYVAVDHGGRTFSSYSPHSQIASALYGVTLVKGANDRMRLRVSSRNSRISYAMRWVPLS